MVSFASFITLFIQRYCEYLHYIILITLFLFYTHNIGKRDDVNLFFYIVGKQILMLCVACISLHICNKINNFVKCKTNKQW